ncbi:MAG: hypothetical protein PHD61_05260 [Bacteroidales bacterium]|nr:hypothetical protein [Lentimicrobiaceae bacterium]MDD5694693.1 hypothetical protein [Bacteroidales bacterium]
MMKSFTFEDLFSHSFNKRLPQRRVGLETVNRSQPKPGVISMILNYSRALSVQESKILGTISYLMN